jgi:hypothetical protein
MKKIPVIGSVLFAYRFVFTHILDIVRVSWLPVVLYTLLDFVLRAYLMRLQPDLNAGNLLAATNALTAILFWMLISMFLLGQASVNMTREALGQVEERRAFPLGRTAWRMFGALIRYSIGVFALFFLAAAVSLLAFSLAGLDARQPLEQQDVGPAGQAAAILAAALVIYAAISALRMGFFLPAVITAETQGGVRRAHELTKRNFWRVLLVALLVGCPVLFLFGVRFSLAANATGALAGLADFFFNCVMILLIWALWCSGAAYAYRSLVPGGGTGEASRTPVP